MSDAKRKGTLIYTDREGKIGAIELDLPIEQHFSAVAWGMDMFRAMMHFSRFRKWLLRLVVGKYAYREMVGLRDCIEQYGYDCHNPDIGYGLENQSYHKEKVRL